MKKILVADDVPVIRTVVTAVLRRPDIQIFEAVNGREALEIHRRERVNLLLVDRSMPELNGEELCRIIRADPLLASTSIVIHTGSLHPDEATRCIQAGANEVLFKPAAPQELLRVVRKYVDVALRVAIRALATVDVESSVGRVTFTGTTVNISISGMLLDAEQHLSVGDAIQCRFRIPRHPVPVSAPAQVVRVSQGSGPGRQHYGVRFTGLAPEALDVIATFVKSQPPL